MDLLEDLLSESSAAKAPVASKFKPKAKAKARPKKGPTTAAKSLEENAPKDALSAPVVSDTETVKESSNIPDVSLASSSPFTCTTQTTRDKFTLSTNHASSDFQIDVEEARSLSNVDIVETTSFGAEDSGNKAVNLESKVKGQDGEHDSVENIADLSNDLSFSSEKEDLDGEVPEHAEELVFVSNPSPKRPDAGVSVNAVTDQSDDVSSGEMDVASNILDQGEEHEKRKTFDASHCSDNEPDEGPVLSGVEANIGGSGLSDGINEEPHENSKSPTKDDNNSVEDGTIKKKRGRMSKQAASENDKPVRKRKKAVKETDQSIDKPLKKFPHATTRRKRCVDKSLLEAQDSLNLLQLPIKDLILLAEHKERVAKKQVASVQPASTNERIDHPQSEDFPYDDFEPFGFDHDRDSIDEPSTSGIKTDTGYFNYHTHMQKKSRAKWSKQDTELFYQGIRQFGSDLSMIEQLFPGRTRAQMKLKFKKEERENPMMIQEAMANKAKDFSHFQLVIERLQAAAEREEAFSEDDASHLMGEDGKQEENLETDATSQEAAKSEQNVEEDTGHEELHGPKDESLPGFDDEEEEFEYQGLL